MNRISIIALFFFSSIQIMPQSNNYFDQDVCILFIKNDTIDFKYGLLGEEGNWRLLPEFSWLELKKDRVVGTKNETHALFTISGEQLIPFQKERIDLYSYYNADDPIYTKENGKRVILDNMGIPIVDKNSEEAYEAFYGYYMYTKEGKIGIVSPNRRLVFFGEAEYIQQVTDNLFLVYKKDKSYLYNYAGQLLKTYNFKGEPQKMSSIHYPYATIESNGLYGICKITDGSITIPPIYKRLNYTDDTTAVLTEKNGKCGLMNYEGKIIIDTIYDEYIIDFNNNIGMRKDSLWVIFDYKGKQLSDFKYKEIVMDGIGSGHSFSCAKFMNRWMLLDSLARPISSAYDHISRRWGGLKASVVEKNGKFGLINLWGKESIPCKYDELLLSEIHLLVAKENGKYGVVDTGGKIIVPFIYDAIEFDVFGKGYYVYQKDLMLKLKKNNLYGLADVTGKIIFPVMYKYLSYYYGKVIIYNYEPCFNCEGLMRMDVPKEPERMGICSVDGKSKTDYKYDNILYVFPNGAIVFELGGRKGYRTLDGKEKWLE